MDLGLDIKNLSICQRFHLNPTVSSSQPASVVSAPFLASPEVARAPPPRHSSTHLAWPPMLKLGCAMCASRPWPCSCCQGAVSRGRRSIPFSRQLHPRASSRSSSNQYGCHMPRVIYAHHLVGEQFPAVATREQPRTNQFGRCSARCACRTGTLRRRMVPGAASGRKPTITENCDLFSICAC
jgi:hypothetical protein